MVKKLEKKGKNGKELEKKGKTVKKREKWLRN